MNKRGSSTLSQTAKKKPLDATRLPWRPSIPGIVIQEDVLDRFQLTQGDLANRLGVARRTINELVGGKRSISTEMALKLSALTGQSAEYWLALQMNFDLFCAGQNFDPSKIESLNGLRSPE